MNKMHKSAGAGAGAGSLVVLGVLAVMVLGFAGPVAATSRVSFSASADIRVWLDDTRDVYANYDNVAISLRAARDCYATVFVVDTDGFVHIVRPFSRYDDAWIYGGRTYRYTSRELGLAGLRGRGVAHVFAIASPYPFDYSSYDEEMFAGGFGYRIYGDPFVACREIYISLLPASCRWDFVGVSFARFYIREWSRYPHYLCRGHSGVHVRVGDYCRSCAHIYDGYRVHVADPYIVIHPRQRFKGQPARYAELKRSTHKYKSMVSERVVRDGDVRSPRTIATKGAEAVSRRSAVKGRMVSSSRGREAVAGWTRDNATKQKVATRKTTSRVVSKPTKSRQTVTTKSIQSRSKASSPTARAAKKGAERGKKTTSKKSR